MVCKNCGCELKQSDVVCSACRAIVGNEEYKAVQKDEGIRVTGQEGYTEPDIMKSGVRYVVVAIVTLISLMASELGGYNILSMLFLIAALDGIVLYMFKVTDDGEKRRIINDTRYRLPVSCKKNVFYGDVKALLEANGYDTEMGLLGVLKVKKKNTATVALDLVAELLDLIFNISRFKGTTAMCIRYDGGEGYFRVSEEFYIGNSKMGKPNKKAYAEAIRIAALIQRYYEGEFGEQYRAAYPPSLSSRMSNTCDTDSKAKWECPECGEMNLKSNRTCKSCGYQN